MGRKKKTAAEQIFTENLTTKVKKEKKEKNIQKLALQFINDPSEKNFGLLCERINWGLRSYIFKIVKDDDATTEVLMRTFENIYFKRDQFNAKIAQFSTWMYRIAFNNSLKYLQEKNKVTKYDKDFEDLYESTICTDANESSEADSYSVSGDINIVKEGNKLISYDKEKIISDFYDASIKCIDDLPDNLRIVMHDRLINQKKIDDIARDNQIPISSVKNWIRRGKIELQEIIKNKYSALYDMYIDIA